VILLPDPYSFATDVLLRRLHREAPGVPVLGGLSSGRTFEHTAALFHDELVLESGMVGARLDGVEMLPCVSQGAAPLGPELTITRAEGHVIAELAGKSALAKLREVFEELTDRERGLINGGLLVGLVIDAGKPEYEQGDFLVRGLLGADPEVGSIAVGAPVSTGQIVRLHARDARSADRDLREALGLRRTALGGRPPAGALMFTCNGRGRGMFGVPDHDSGTLAAELGAIPTAGFFAAGEIGPVGGESFLHGFTATVAVFPGSSGV
jgi:small ligand-binding sensory domain FIST